MSSNRVAFLTGVGPGLGASLARRFARDGFSLGLVARHSDFIEELAGELSAAGSRAIGVVADVGLPEEVKSAVARVRAELGKSISSCIMRALRRERDCSEQSRKNSSAPGERRR